MELRSSCTEAQQPCQACLYHERHRRVCLTPPAATRETPGDPDANNVEFLFCSLTNISTRTSSHVGRRGLGAWCLITRLTGDVASKGGIEHIFKLKTANGPLISPPVRWIQDNGNMYSILKSSTTNQDKKQQISTYSGLAQELEILVSQVHDHIFERLQLPSKDLLGFACIGDTRLRLLGSISWELARSDGLRELFSGNLGHVVPCDVCVGQLSCSPAAVDSSSLSSLPLLRKKFWIGLALGTLFWSRAWTWSHATSST